MATEFTAAFIQERINAIKAQIIAHETAMVSLSSGTIKSYTLNTGQTVQTVTKRNLSTLQSEIDALIGLLEYWDTMLNGGGTVLARSLS